MHLQSPLSLDLSSNVSASMARQRARRCAATCDQPAVYAGPVPTAFGWKVKPVFTPACSRIILNRAAA
ncbi:hypothetical protein BaRGS_00003701 [Batillaria attramentaria]|uniref:Uncharacterized protein n=1 Tax=Batillaria attramentaria TaxID=370345 RepID=A0ABD0M0W2_9CAEN